MAFSCRWYAFMLMMIAMRTLWLLFKSEQQWTKKHDYLMTKTSIGIAPMIHKRNESSWTVLLPSTKTKIITTTTTREEEEENATTTTTTTNEKASTKQKLFPLHRPIPHSFLRDIPVAPLLLEPCRVEFIIPQQQQQQQEDDDDDDDKRMSLCSTTASSETTTTTKTTYLTDSIGIDVVVRLLEHRFECSAQHLRIQIQQQQQQQRQTNTRCLWVPPMDYSTTGNLPNDDDIVWDGTNATINVSSTTSSTDHLLFLLPFIYTDFYPLVKYRRYTPGSHCILGDYYPLPTIPYRKGKDVTQQHEFKQISLHQSWKHVFEQARFCDYIASNVMEGLIVGDSMGIPVLGLLPNNNNNNNNYSSNHDLNHTTTTTTTTTKTTMTRISKRYPMGNDIFNDALYSRPRSHMFPPPLERHDVDAAQRIVETFPFFLFTTTRTTAKPISTSTSTTHLQKLDTVTLVRNTTSSDHHDHDDDDESPAAALPNKTLVILLGSLRGGESTWQSMYQNLLDINHADLALMIGKTKTEVYTNNDTMSGSGVPTSHRRPPPLSPYQRAKYVWEFNEYKDWADAIDLVNGTAWRTYMKEYVSKPSGILGGIQDYPGSGAIIFMARHWLLEHLLPLRDTYDRFVLTRSDQYYKCPQPLDEFDLRYLWVPGPTTEDYGGITDRHWIMNKHHLEKALRIIQNLILHWDRMFTGRIGHNPEALIKASWTMDSLFPHQIRRYARTHYTAYVEGDTSRWHNQKNKWGLSDDGVNIKYMDEYKLASCVCSNTDHNNNNNSDNNNRHRRDLGLYDYEHNLSYGEFTDAYQSWTCHQNTSSRGGV